MTVALQDLELEPLVLHLPTSLALTDDQFFELCQANKEMRLERTAGGDILFMAPAGGEASSQGSELTHELRAWAKRDRSGVSFDSSGGFILPNGAILSPDAAWVLKARLRKLKSEQKKKFLPLCPDFVVELLSPTDRLSATMAKMQEYIDNGARLGWLIDPARRQVHIYRPQAQPERLDHAKKLSADPELPGFTLDLRDIWDPGF
jgi:Uma2 family endonuclease